MPFSFAPVMPDMDQFLPSTIRPWVEQEFCIEGVLAAGGGNLVGTVFPALAHADYNSAQGEEVWHCIAQTLGSLSNHGTATRERLWGFDHGMLCTVRREDGLWIGVFTSMQIADEAALTLRAKLDAFKVQDFRE